MLQRMEESRKFAMMIQLFADGDGGGTGGNDGGAGGAGNEGGAGNNNGGGAGTGAGTGGDEGGAGAGDGKKPFAVFPDEKSFMNRVKREAQAQAKDIQAGLLKDLGIEDIDSLKALIAAENQRKEDELTETQKLQKKLDELQTRSQEAQQRAEQTARTAEAKTLATEIGVNPARINHFLKLADLNDIKVAEDGSVDSEAMRTKLTTLLNELPEFKGQPPVQRGGGDFGGSNNQPTGLTMEQIKRMSKDEIAANIVEVRKVMASQK